eukprot:scaffold408_cov71-Cylindrotheca_fusiformis.AAC.29
MEYFRTATTAQGEVNASPRVVWELFHHPKMFPSLFSTCFMAEAIGTDPRRVGHKIRVTRLLPSKHCFSATYTVVRHEEENMEIQWYSEDLGGPGKATTSSTWSVTPIPGQPRRCILTISFAVIPQTFAFNAGKMVFAPLIKKLSRRAVKQDVKDFALYCDLNPGKLEKWEMSSSQKDCCGSVAGNTHDTMVSTGSISMYDDDSEDSMDANDRHRDSIRYAMPAYRSI